jgi:hypothetical protein
MASGVPYILETVFIILYIIFFVYLFDKKTEGLIIIFLFILTFFAGFKTISDLYNLDKKVKFDFLNFTKTSSSIFEPFYKLATYMYEHPLPLWIFTVLPISLSIISLLLIVLTVSYIKKSKKNTKFGDIPFERKPRKLLDDYKGLFISNFVFLIVFILGTIGVNLNTKSIKFENLLKNESLSTLLNVLKLTYFNIFENGITISINNIVLQSYLFALYIIIFVISLVMISFSSELFQMRTNQLFTDG